MRLSKSDFINYINALQESSKKYSYYCDILSIELVEKVCIAFQTPHDYLEKVVFTETELDYINWYIHEDLDNEDKKVYEDDIIYDVSTPEGLYDFLKTFEKGNRQSSLSNKLKDIVSRSQLTTVRGDSSW